MRVPLKRLIAATDFSDMADVAVRYGFRLARELDAKLFLCHVIPLSYPTAIGEVAYDPLTQQQQLMEEATERLAQQVGDEPLDWEPLVTVGNPAEVVPRMAAQQKVDLVICGTHGRSGLKRLLLGSVAERLVRTLPCPLLVVRSSEAGPAEKTDASIRFRRILVGVDFSPDSDLALEYGLSLAQEFQSELRLAHVIAPPAYKSLLKPSKEEESDLGQLRILLDDKLKNMVSKEALHWCTPVTVLLAGQPYEELTKYALVNEIDLIVLGVRGHGLVETLFMGSTTDRVIRQAPCPVLSVQPATWNRERN